MYAYNYLQVSVPVHQCRRLLTFPASLIPTRSSCSLGRGHRPSQQFRARHPQRLCAAAPCRRRHQPQLNPRAEVAKLDDYPGPALESRHRSHGSWRITTAQEGGRQPGRDRPAGRRHPRGQSFRSLRLPPRPKPPVGRLTAGRTLNPTINRSVSQAAAL